MKPSLFLLLAFQLVFLSCTPNKTEEVPATSTPVALSVSTNRINATQFEVIIDTANLTGFNLADLQLSLTGGTSTTWTTSSANIYKSTITSSQPSGQIPYTVSWNSTTYSRTAIILPNIDSKWNLPEAVPGYVNTDGWEDSPEISPDGQYLIVSTYSPVSIFQCILDGALRTTPTCNNNSYSLLLTERPNFPGASRVLSNTTIDHNISLLDPPDTTNAFPPVSSYVFQVQSDLTFKNAKPIYVDWEAYTWGAPFGFNFRKKNSTGNYQLYTAFGDPSLGNGNKLQTTTLDFTSSDLKLGTMSRVMGTLTKSNWQMTPLNIPGLASQTGNPFSTLYDGSTTGYLFWDDESVAANQREIFFATETNTGVLGSKQTVGLANPGIDKYQPYFHAGKLYYSFMHGLILSQALNNTADLSQSANWDAPVIEIGVDTGHSHSGRISAIGEPSLYVDGEGKRWLYFAYAVNTTGASLNLNIGRVREK